MKYTRGDFVRSSQDYPARALGNGDLCVYVSKVGQLRLGIIRELESSLSTQDGVFPTLEELELLKDYSKHIVPKSFKRIINI